MLLTVNANNNPENIGQKLPGLELCGALEQEGCPQGDTTDVRVPVTGRKS